jgi:hypothetical protein
MPMASKHKSTLFSKPILILTVLFVALLIGVSIRNNQKPTELATEEYVPLDLSVDKDKVAKITISNRAQADTKVELIKENADWKVSSLWNARADQEKINNLLKGISEAKGEVRAKGKNLFSDFGIEDDKAVHVVFSDTAGKEMLTFFIGTKKADADSLFIRKQNADAVYLTDANLLGNIGIYGEPAEEKPSSEYWASTVIANFDVNQVTGIETHQFENGREKLIASVKREANKWQFTRPEMPFPIDAEKVRLFFDSMKNWRAQKVFDPKAEDYGFSKPSWQMTLTLENGTPIKLVSGKTDESGNVYLQSSSEPVVFQMSKYFFENLNADDSHFFVDNPLGIDADKTEHLVIRADKKTWSFMPKEKKWESLTTYLNELKNFRAERLILDSKDEAKLNVKSSRELEVHKEGQVYILRVGDKLNEKNEYAAQIVGKHAFAISEAVFKSTFDNPDRLKEPEISKPAEKK